MPSSAISVLLLEDYEELRTLWVRDLVRAGLVVDGAGSCAEAVGLIQRKPFDVFLFDHRLSDGIGCDVLRYARARGVTAPAIVCSAVAGPHDTLDYGLLGAVRFICKPIESGVVVAAIRAIATASALESIASPIVLALQHLRSIGSNSPDSLSRSRAITFRLMSDPRVNLFVFAMLLDASRQADVPGILAALEGIDIGSFVLNAEVRRFIDCIAISTETDSRALATACGASHSFFLKALHSATDRDARYWLRLARLRRALRLVISGEKLDFVAEVAGFSSGDQLSRDFHTMFGVTISDVKALMLRSDSELG